MRHAGWLAALMLAASARAATSCQSLTGLRLKNLAITTAETVAQGAFTPPGVSADSQQAGAYRVLPEFCRIAATLTPSRDSQIQIEVWMPSAGWNRDLQSVGNGAWAGSISYPAMATALSQSYATAGTDTGHSGNSATFALGHPERVMDFAFRATHEMTVAAKAIIMAYYGQGPELSFWNGCSTGGRQALTEAERYPSDYDGIVAGAPAIHASYLQGAQVWITQVTNRDPAGYIPPAKYRVLHDAVLAACDALDGVADSVLEDPTRCRFDPGALQCGNGDSPSCLTAAQVAVARQIYAGMPSKYSDKPLVPGLEYGSELGWATLSSPQPMALAEETYKYLVFADGTWDYRTFDPDRDVARARQAIGGLLDAIDPDLQPFFEHKTASGHGGKLLLYHGWADPGIMPRNSIQYYASVAEKVGEEKAADSIRLFLVPGMGHCRGGDGPDSFDALSVLKTWVQTGNAPEQMTAAKVRGGVTERTRPLCAYPNVAKYKGTGNTDQASSFVCAAPER